jgi:hypothetical protein
MVEWIDGVAAVLEAWLMGQAGGGAIADILYGVVNPSGKLAETFPLRLEDTPAFINFPGEHGQVRYGEGLFIGYRYYDAKQAPVLLATDSAIRPSPTTRTSRRLVSRRGRHRVWMSRTGHGRRQEIVQFMCDRQSGVCARKKNSKALPG